LPGRRRPTDRAPRIFLEADGAPFHVQRIEQQQSPAQGFANAGGQFERLGGLHGADDAGQRGENPHHCAAHLLDILAFRKQAVIAR